MSTSIVDIPQGSEGFALLRSVDLDGITVRLRFRWADRAPLEGWYLTVEDADGEPLTIQSPARGGGTVRFDPRQTTAPPGYLLWVGPSEYSRDALGQTLRLAYVSP